MACRRVGRCWEASWAAVVVVAVVVGVVVLAGSVESFNPDRPIIKWSPLWLNNYRPRGILYKRFRDEPIDKWTPGYFSSSSDYYYDQKKEAGGCGRENSLCRFVSVRSGEPRQVRCCGGPSVCVYGGVLYLCRPQFNRFGNY